MNLLRAPLNSRLRTPETGTAVLRESSVAALAMLLREIMLLVSVSLSLSQVARSALGLRNSEIDRINPKTGTNLLHGAAASGDSGLTAQLLRAGADPNMYTTEGSIARGAGAGGTALLFAAENGYAEVVSELIMAGAKVDAANPRGNTALFLAATKGHTDIVMALLAAGASLEARGEFGQDTPLTRASYEGHADVVERLLAAGANAEAHSGTTSTDGTRWMGGNALLQAAKGCDERRGNDVQYLGEDRTSTAEATIVGMLMQAGADATVRDRFGETPLFVATSAGCFRAVEALLKDPIVAERCPSANFEPR